MSLATEAMPETRLHFCHFPAVLSHVLCFISALTYLLVWLYVYIGIQEAAPLRIYGWPYLRDLEYLTVNTLFDRNRHRLRSYIHLYTTNLHYKPTRTVFVCKFVCVFIRMCGCVITH